MLNFGLGFWDLRVYVGLIKKIDFDNLVLDLGLGWGLSRG